jgi:hypothetical protein
MKKIYKLIKKHPQEFINILRFLQKDAYLCNEHWDNFDGTNYLIFVKKSKDGGIEADQIWFDFENDQEGSTNMVIGIGIKKPIGLLKFKGYIIPYRLDFDWDD